jgi:NAD(P)-dependent dehydrogenase (short-subunit alcohol dehydrogenase family)
MRATRAGYSPWMQMDGRVVVVTGASSGIGRATAIRAAGDGARVVLVARGERSLKEAARVCAAAGAASATVVPADVGDDAAVEDLVRRVVDEHGRIDVFVSNAGVVAYGRTEDVPQEVFDGVLRTNLLGAVNVARHVVPVLREQQAGSLLYVGSVIGHIGVPQMSAYTVSKWGVRALARQLQLENRDLSDVHIGYVAPGGVDTPIYRQAANYGGFVGRPPPPVSSPERVARQILGKVGRSRVRAQLNPANDLIRFGFVAMPLVYDYLVGPLYRLASIDLGEPVEPTPGNVLDDQEDANALRGGHGDLVVGLARNGSIMARDLLRRVGGGR